MTDDVITEQSPSLQCFQVSHPPSDLLNRSLICSSMADGNKTRDVPVKAGGQLKDPLRWISSVDSSQRLAVSLSRPSPPLSATQRCSRIVPGNGPENWPIVREALLMNLPHHLVLQTVQHRARTHGASYSQLTELVADMFPATNVSGEDQEVPMETDQLEEALMMNTPVVRKALQAGAPPHLIKPLVRAKILSNEVGYSDVSELLIDLNLT